MRAPGPRPPRTLHLALATCLACAAGLMHAATHPLETATHLVLVELSDALVAVRAAEGASLTAWLSFPSGEPLAAPSWGAHPESVRIVLRPLAPGTPTRTEALLERAVATRLPHASGRPWFDRRTDDGIAVYMQVTQEVWTFQGSDGARVGVTVPATPLQHTHLASRRYGEHLEVIYQFGREHTDLRAMDAFVLGQLRRHVRSAVSRPR